MNPDAVARPGSFSGVAPLGVALAGVLLAALLPAQPGAWPLWLAGGGIAAAAWVLWRHPQAGPTHSPSGMTEDGHARLQAYAGLANDLEEGFVVLDQHLRYVYANAAVKKLLGEDMVGRMPRHVFEPETGARLETLGRQVMATRRSMSNTTRMELDGTTRWIESTIYPAASGGVFVIGRDVTNRFQEEQRYRDLSESISDVFLSLDKNLQYTYWNQACEKAFGLTAKQILGRTAGSVAPRMVSSPLHALYRRVLDTGVAGTLLNEVKTANGPVHLSVSVFPTRTGISVLGRDITPLVLAEQQLHRQRHELQTSLTTVQASEKQLRDILDSMFIFAGLLSLDGRLLYANSVPLQTVGTTLDQVLGKSFADMPWWSQPGQGQRIRQALARATAGETVRIELAMLDAGGRQRHVDAAFAPLRDTEGRITQVIGSGVDITDRKQSELDLQQSRDWYRAMVDNFPNGAVFLFDHDLRYLVAGGRELTDVGIPSEALVGKTLSEVLPAAGVEKLRPLYARALGGETLVAETGYAPNDTLHQIHATPIRNAAGEVTAGMVMSQNITARRRAEESMRFYQHIIDHMTDPVYWCAEEDDFRLIYANNAACVHFGMPRETLLAKHVTDLDPSFSRQDVSASFAYIRQHGHVRFETTQLGAGGRLIPVEISAFYLEYHGKHHAVSYVRSLSEQQQAARQLAQEKERLELTLLGAGLGLWDWNMTTDEVLYNDQWGAMLGFAPHEIVQTLEMWSRLAHPDDAPLVLAGLQEHIQGRTAISQNEHRMRCKDGTWKWILATAKVVERTPDQAPLRVVGIHLDITPRKELEEQQQRLNEELERQVALRTAQLTAANGELEAFSYSVSHDLRAPLRIINGFSKALLEDYQDRLDTEGRDYLHTVRTATQHMGQLIDDLLKLSRITRTDLQPEPTDLHELVAQVVADLCRDDPAHQPAVSITAPLPAMGDSRLLRVMLHNLMGNAWKFTRRTPDAAIDVGRTATSRGMAYYVRDNGAGFPMQYADKLFKAFQRLHSQDEFEGTGIGLATVQRIVRLHGGEVWAEGEMGRGATFFFTLAPESR